jgi:hypothetical protein
VSERVVYAGAAWCHPMMRGRSLSSLIPRTSKALALAKWNFDHMVGLMEETSMRRGLAQRFGYSSPEMGARMSGRSGETLNFAVLSMPREEVVQHIRDFSAGDGAQVDSVIDRRLA